MRAVVWLFITLTSAAPPIAAEPAPAAPTAKFARSSLAAAVSIVAPRAWVRTSSPIAARVTFSMVLMAAATPTPAVPPTARPLATFSTSSVLDASSARLPCDASLVPAPSAT